MRYLLFAILLTVPSFSQTKAEAEAFRLSMPKIQATLSAYTNLFDVLAHDPTLVARWKAEKAKLTDTNGRDTLSLVSQRLSSDPRVAAAFTKAGITPKEAGMTMETLVGSMLGAAMLESAGAKAGLPKGFVKENVDFAKAHKDEIAAAMQKMAEAAKKYPQLAKVLEDDEEEEK